MEECLKTARSAHWALILMCLAILIFTETPDKSEKYRKAMQELEALQVLDLQAFAVRSSTLLDEPVDAEHMTRLVDTLVSYEYPDKNSLSAASNLTAKGRALWLAEKPPQDGTLEEIFAYLQRGRVILMYPDEKHLCSDFAQKAKLGDGDFELVELTVGFLLSGKELWDRPFSYLVTIQSKRGGMIHEVRGQIRAQQHHDQRAQSFSELWGPNVSGDLKNRLGVLLVDRGGREVLFPELRSVWQDVRKEKPLLALPILEEKESSVPRLLHIPTLGFSLDASIVGIFGPVAGLAAALWLLASLLNIQALGPLDRQALGSFSWFTLFDTWPSRIITFVTFNVLPVLAYGLLVYRFYVSRVGPSWEMIICFLGSCGVFALAVIAYWRVSVLKKRACELRSLWIT